MNLTHLKNNPLKLGEFMPRFHRTSLYVLLFVLVYVGVQDVAKLTTILKLVAYVAVAVYLHEVGHYVTARMAGANPTPIFLHIAGGGVGGISGLSPTAHAFVVFAGPLVNLLLGLLIFVDTDWIGHFAYINLILGLFNLLPVLPCDGGHLRDWALHKLPYTIANPLRLGIGLCSIVGILFLYPNTIMLLFCTFFLLSDVTNIFRDHRYRRSYTPN